MCTIISLSKKKVSQTVNSSRLPAEKVDQCTTQRLETFHNWNACPRACCTTTFTFKVSTEAKTEAVAHKYLEIINWSDLPRPVKCRKNLRAAVLNELRYCTAWMARLVSCPLLFRYSASSPGQGERFVGYLVWRPTLPHLILRHSFLGSYQVYRHNYGFWPLHALFPMYIPSYIHHYSFWPLHALFPMYIPSCIHRVVHAI